MFYVGQKVVCVDGSFDELMSYPRYVADYQIVFPVQGNVYTVRAFNTGGGLYLNEIVNQRSPWRSGMVEEVSWLPRRFRPLVERKTDISIFTDMLKPKTEQVSA